MIIEVKVKTNTLRETLAIDNETKIGDVLERVGAPRNLRYNIDGAYVFNDDTISQYSDKESVELIGVEKADSAAE